MTFGSICPDNKHIKEWSFKKKSEILCRTRQGNVFWVFCTASRNMVKTVATCPSTGFSSKLVGWCYLYVIVTQAKKTVTDFLLN